MNNKPTVSIAIPAYNEEKNIVDLLHDIKLQKSKNYKLVGIYVYSDGSTDNTVHLIKSNFNDVKIIDSKVNMGKNKRINQIMKANKSDILIQVDADIKLANRLVFENIIKPILRDSKVGIVCAYHLSLKPKSFIGTLAYFGFEIWDEARASLGKNGTRYYCEGGLRAFSKSFTQEFQLPLNKHVGEDSYSFYFAVKNGFKVTVSKSAKVYIDLADNYKDYTKQMKRFLKDPGMVEDTFEEELVEKYETMNLRVKLMALLKVTVRKPVVGFMYLVLQTSTKLMAINYDPGKKWIPIERK